MLDDSSHGLPAYGVAKVINSNDLVIMATVSKDGHCEVMSRLSKRRTYELLRQMADQELHEIELSGE